jgi:hypothetical protein
MRRRHRPTSPYRATRRPRLPRSSGRSSIQTVGTCSTATACASRGSGSGCRQRRRPLRRRPRRPNQCRSLFMAFRVTDPMTRSIRDLPPEPAAGPKRPETHSCPILAVNRILRSRYEITCPFIGISLRLLMPFSEFLRSSYSLTTAYCAEHKIDDTPTETAQSRGEPDEGRRAAPLGRVPALQAWVRGEGRALALRPVQGREPSPRTKQRGERCSHYSALRSILVARAERRADASNSVMSG